MLASHMESIVVFIARNTREMYVLTENDPRARDALDYIRSIELTSVQHGQYGHGAIFVAG